MDLWDIQVKVKGGEKVEHREIEEEQTWEKGDKGPKGTSGL